MISRYEAYMNGTALSSIDPSIYVLNIQPGDVKQNIRTNKVANRPGSRIGKTEIDNASVTIFFEIHEYDTVKRQAICQKVRKWAKKGILEISDRPGQRLNCVCDTFPVAKLREWTETLSVSFTAFNPPYWEEKNPVNVSISGASSASVYIPGNAPETLVSAVVTCGASISSITLSAGSKSLILSEIGASANDKIYVGYDENRILYIKKNSTSILEKRTGDDELVIPCGELVNFAVNASASLSTVFSVRGCWY